MWLISAIRWTHHPHIRESVLHCSRMKRSQSLGFGVIECNNEFAALVEGQSPIVAIGPQHSPTRLAQRRPQGSGRVIQAGMNDSAVPPGLMLC